MTAAVQTPAREIAACAPRARFWDLIASEWIKLWSLRSTSWSFLLTGLAIIGFNVNAARADYNNYPYYSANIHSQFVPYWAVRDAFTFETAILLVIATGAMGANIIVSEYSSGLIRTTLAAVPDRRAVMLAKAAVIAVVFSVFGALIAAASFATTQAILSGREASVPITYPGVLRVEVASALLATVCALSGMAIGAMIRHSATTMVSAILLLLVAPTLLLDDHRWTADLDHALPLTAWQRLSQVGQGFGGPFPATISGSWIVYAAWSVAAVVLTLVFVDRRDV